MEQQQRITHHLEQGTDAWHEFRLAHFGASEAAAMLALSKKTTRTELLRAKHTGIAREFSAWVQENILDHGHEVEAMARPIVEAMIGDDLYPATMSYGRLSASCDGLTMDGETAFEHKQYNAALFAAIQAGELPDEHQPQAQQVIHVTGAKRLIFVCSDGTAENMASMEVAPDPAWVKRIDAGWVQFAEDLANYQHVEVVPAAVAAPIKDLPAVVLTVSGSLTIETNFSVWGVELRDFISKIPEKPATDQEFADCKAAIAAFKKAEAQLDNEEKRVLSMVTDIDAMQREKKLLRDLSSTTRLTLEKMVVRRDIEVKAEIMQAGKDQLAAHIAGLNKRLAKVQMPPITADFAAAIKGKKLYDSMRGAVSDLVVTKRLEANEIADRIDANLKTVAVETEYHFLFSDIAALAMKQPDDLALIIRTRIADHKREEERRAELAREKIRAEEEAKAAAKVRAEQAEAERQRKAAEEAAAKIERDRLQATQATPTAVLADKAVADANARAFVDSISITEPATQEKPADVDPGMGRPTPAVAGHTGMTGSARLLDHLDDLARQMTEQELSDLCIHAAHILENRRAAA